MINLSQFEMDAPKASDNSSMSRDGGVTFVYHKNGKRIVFSKRILDLLGNPEKVKFGFINDYLIIMSSENEGFTLRDMNKQKVIYNAPLIKETLDRFGIQYDDRYCKTFSEIEEIEGKTDVIALKMK